MLFNFPKTCASEVKIYMNGNLIEHTSSTKFLGINIDKDLKWKHTSMKFYVKCLEQ